MKIDEKKLIEIPGLTRCETSNRDKLLERVMDITRSVYPHDQLYGQYCPIQIYVDCPPEIVFEYMSNLHSLSEWTYSTRDFKETEKKGLFVGKDTLEENTKIYAKVVSNKEALIVDYHCAWDQGDELWMIYLNRIVPAQTVLKKPGSVIFWQNCKHPYYDKNPFPEKAPPNRAWVGEFWDFFYAGHTVEFENLKRILEFRFKNGLKIGPYLEEK